MLSNTESKLAAVEGERRRLAAEMERLNELLSEVSEALTGGLDPMWQELVRERDEARAENKELADRLVHRTGELRAKIDAALAVIREIREGLGSDSLRDMLQEIEEALTGGRE